MSARSRYPVPAERVRVQEEITRSRFITTAGRASTVDAAKAFIAEVRSEFGGATHNCFAFAVGAPGSTALAGMSDDGEPPGTAGRPMLTVVQGSGIGDLVVVVTRYFGGTKLGTGGLVRAYSGGVKAALEIMPVVEKVSRVALLVSGAYHWITPLERLLPEFEATIVAREFAADVTWHVEAPEERVEGLATALVELSHGELKVVL